jgi:hypothetical protein
MAMTGGTAYCVRHVKANYGNASWYIDLYVYVKEQSRSIEYNETTLALGMYVVTPGAAYDIGQWDDWNATSYVGSTSNTFNGTIPNFGGTRWIVENKYLTVKHNADGTRTVSIPWYWNVNSPWGQYVRPSGSFDYTITTIPRATVPTVSVASVNMGSSITISMPRASSSFTHTLKYSMGNQSGTIGSGLGTSASWTVPYSLANAIPNSKSGTCTITCETWSGGTWVGSKTVTFTANVPEDANTRPSVSCVSTPVSSLGDTFKGLFIQGLTNVKTEITASGKYGAGISAYYSLVGNTGETYSPSGAVYTHPCPVSPGQAQVAYTAYDTRGIGSSSYHYINVLPYSKPAVIPYTGENSIVCERIKEFNQEKGIWEATNKVRIKAGRQYGPIISDGQQRNYCTLRYRHKASSASDYSAWKTLIARDNISSNVVDVIIEDIATSITTSYDVQINAVDDIGYSQTIPLTIPTDEVNFHEREGGDGAAFGKYSEKPKSLEIADDWDIVVYGDRWNKLSYSSAVTASTHTDWGKAPLNDAVYYRVENGNHVYVAFNCACEFTGNQIAVNSKLIPEEYRPAREVLAMCPTDGRAVARILVLPTGKVVIDWLQLLSSAADTTSRTATWIDGYIDYFILP